ncbi:hypothetical protein C8Q72DRAFT_888749 [Fomitopsis betulina]|nr:hypothetical protein C8Q72DRAFT_888749 [Fomitopsis betulina]
MVPERKPQLPLELCHHILTFLRNDSPTLLSCNLVCHAWLSAARAYIFHTLVIESEGKYRRTIRMFADHPHLTRYVQELQVVGTMLLAHRAFGELFAVAPNLPHLRHLCLQRWAFFDEYVASHFPPCSPRGRVPGTFASVHDLVLHVVFPRPLDFVQLIRACPSLRTLHMSVMLFLDGDHDVRSGTGVAPPPETISLDTLTWRKSALFPLQWLLRNHTKLAPRTMSLAWSEESAIGSVPYSEEMNAAAALVHEALYKTGPALERLELCADHGRDHELADYGLSHCVNLREIRLESSYRNKSPWARDLSWIVHALRQLNSPVLQSVEVGLAWDEPVSSDSVTDMLAGLDDALAHLAQDRPGIVISLLLWTWLDDLIDHIGNGLPQLQATGARFCVRMDAEGMRRAYSETDVNSHLSYVYDYEPGDSQPTTPTLETAPLLQVQEQVRWYPRRNCILYAPLK